MENTATAEKEEMGFNAHLKMDKKFMSKMGEILLSQDQSFFKKLNSKLQESKTEKQQLIDEKLYFTVNDAAYILRCGPHTVRRMIADEKLEATKPHKSYLITKEALDKVIKNENN